MLMADTSSIRDVLFFPQMKPESKPTAQGKPSKEPCLAPGIPEEWVEPLLDLGYDPVDKLKSEEKPCRFHQKMMEYRKRNKLDFPTVTVEQVAGWLTQTQSNSPW